MTNGDGKNGRRFPNRGGRGETPRPDTSERLSADAAALINELHVYQAELEVQNEDLRQAQSELKTVGDRYFTLFNHAPVGYVVLDDIGMITDANRTFRDMVDRDYENIRGRALTDFLHPSDRPGFLSRYRAFFNVPENKFLEVRLVRSDGKTIWAKLDGTAARKGIRPESDEKRDSLLLTVGDITDRKKLEKALDKRVKELTSLYEVSHVIEGNEDIAGIFQGIADVMRGSLGCCDVIRTELRIGRRKYETRDPYPGSPPYELVEQEVFVGDRRVGDIRMFFVRTDSDADDTPPSVGSRNLLKGIAERLARVVESHDLRQSLEQAGRIVQNSPAILFRWRNEPDWPVAYVSENIARFGYSPQDFLSGRRPYASILHPADARKVSEEVSRYAASDTSEFRQEYRILDADGNTRWVADRTTVERDVEGRPVAFEGLILDITRRKKIADALAESERRFKGVFETSPIGIAMVDPDTQRFVQTNRGFQEIVGYTESELRGMTVEDITHPEDWADERNLITARKNNTIESFGVIKRYVRKDGGIRWVRVTGDIFESSEGRSLAVANAVDITDIKDAEMALRESETRFRSFVENAGDNVYSLTPDGVFTYVSPNWRELMGEPPEHAIDHSFEAYIHPDDVPSCVAILKKVLTSGEKKHTVEYRVRRADGEWRWHMSTGGPIRDENGDICGLVGIARDITEKKRDEEALKETKELLELALYSGGMGVWDWEIATGRVDWAAEHAALFGIPIESFGGTIDDVQACVHPDDREQGMAVFRRTLEENADFDNTYRVVWPGGEIRWLHSYGKLVRNADGDPWRIVGITQDVTEQKRMAAERIEMEARTRQLQKSESLGRMAGAIAHHFNNQLGVILGRLELALEDLPERASVRESLMEAKNGVLRASKMSGQMLTYLGQAMDDRERIDLPKLCRATLDMLRAVFPKSVDIQSDLPYSGPEIRGAANQIREVMVNLMTNARESLSDDRGEIRLGVDTVSPSEIPERHRFPVGWEPGDGDYVRITVSDTGAGIPEEDIEHIFDPFFTTKFTGRGMGLPVSLGIMRAHGGAITVTSTLGAGSVFRIFLPASSVGTKRAHVPNNASCRAAAPTDGKVLLVEDEESVRKMTRMMLARMGKDVIEAADGHAAIALFKERMAEIGCVICDFAMPRMNGPRTLAAIREISADVPTVLTTGDETVTSESHDWPAAPDSMLYKPFGMSELKAVLARVVGRDSRKAETETGTNSKGDSLKQ